VTPRDIVLANLNHQDAPRPGLTFDAGARINDFHEVRLVPAGWTQRRWVEGPLEFYDDEWGNVWSRLKDGCFGGEIHHPALLDWSALDSLRMPTFDHAGNVARIKRLFADSDGSRFRIANISGWVFTNSRYLRKLENYLEDLGSNPDAIEKLHEMVAAVYEAKIRIAGEAGADGITYAEDFGTQTGPLVGPKMFRRFYKPIYTRLMGLAHSYGMKVLMHSCGQNRMLLEDLIECGVDCFQFDQPTIYDYADLSALFRRRKVTLWSPVDIQKVLPTGDRAFIESEARRMCDAFANCLICKNYGDLAGIGVKPEWDRWAYDEIIRHACPGERPAGVCTG
jgi:uroporphyrinogen decarboxylase